MTPLDEFGLAADADERTVKRAYAKRLKTTRPDEDPEAFQALNEAYKAALAYIVWRDAQGSGGDTRDEESEGPAGGSFEPPGPAGMLQPPSSPLPVMRPFPVPDGRPSPPVPLAETEKPSPPEAGPWANAVEEPDRGDFVFSVSEFFADMREDRRDRDVARFRQWLQRRMSDWPLTARPVLSEAIVTHLIDHRVNLRPDIFDALIEQLGLNDIHAGSVDRMVLEHYREGLVFAFEAEIFTPELPGTLRSKWYQSRLVEMIVILVLVGGGGLALIVGSMMLDGGGKPVAPSTPWYRSFTQKSGDPISVNGLPGADQAAVSAIQAAGKATDESQEIAFLNQAIERLKDRDDLANERLLALALYNKGNTLQHDDRIVAYATYADLQTRFRDRKDHDLALLVAASYVNMGHEDFETNRLDTALPPYDAAVELYGYINEGQIGVQVFNALIGQAETLIAQGKLDEGQRKLDDVDARLKTLSDPVLLDFGNSSKELRNRIAKRRE